MAIKSLSQPSIHHHPAKSMVNHCAVIITKWKPFPLLMLQPELHLIVAESLDPIDRISLKLTNRYFYQIITPLTLKELPSIQDRIYKRRGPSSQAIPGSDVKNDRHPYLACMSCVKLRLSTNFANHQQRCSPVLRVPLRLRGGLTVEPYCLQQRFCMFCGIIKRKAGYKQGDIIRVNDEEFVICNYCNQIGKNGDEYSRRRATGLCARCWSGLRKVRGSERAETQSYLEQAWEDANTEKAEGTADASGV